MGKVPPQMKDETDAFVYGFLRQDGCFIIKMVGRNSSEFLASEFICSLWASYLDGKEELRVVVMDSISENKNQRESRNHANCENGIALDSSKKAANGNV